MSEQNELEFPEPAVSYHRHMVNFLPWLEACDEKLTDLRFGAWNIPHHGQRHSRKTHSAGVAMLIANYQAKSHFGNQIGTTRWDASLPTSAEDREFLAEQRFKTQLMATLRTAQLALREKDDLLQQNHTLTETVHRLAATGHILTSCLAARNDALVCLHEHYSGTVSEIMGEQIVVVYEVADGEPMKQIYDRKQFIADRVPREGDELCAYVFIAVNPPGRALVERSTSAMTEPDFSGFDKGVTGDVEI